MTLSKEHDKLFADLKALRLSITIRLLLAHRLIDLVKLLVPEEELERVRRLR